MHVRHKAKCLQMTDPIMKLATVVLCLTVLHCIIDVDSGVCSNITYTTIHYIRRRIANNNTFKWCIHDVVLNGSWYRFKNVTADKIPKFKEEHCISIWMNGSHPTKIDEVVNRTACTAIPLQRPLNCSDKFDIKVMKCTSYFLYQLKEPQECRYAFCAGTVSSRGVIH